MGFGSFLKKAINPLTPFKAGAKATSRLLHGDVGGSLKAGMGVVAPGLGSQGRAGGSPAAAQMRQYMEQNGLKGIRGGLEAMRGMRDQPMPPEMPSMGEPIGPTPPAVPFTQQVAQALTPPEFSDPYEAWKQGGRQGQRPY